MTISPAPAVETAAPVVFVVRATTVTEARLLDGWVVEHGSVAGMPAEVVRLPGQDGASGDAAPELVDRLARGDDPLLMPIRVAWLPKERDGKRAVLLRDVIATGNPRHPRARLQALLVHKDRGRAQVVCGEPATLSELRRAFTESSAETSDPGAFAAFVTRRATLALERQEAHLLGPQYKVPRLVREEIWSSSRFQDGLASLASGLGRPSGEVGDAAGGCLDEMVAGYGRSRIDLALQLGRFMYRQAYDDELDIDRDDAARVVAAARHHATVVLPTHRSNFDAGVMPTAWHELGLPPTHTFAGINMAFWPLGPLMQRSGSIFIRRDVKEDSVYRYVLREYLGYLVEKRFHLEWYIEGGRSRTGKLLPPRLGLLTYVVDAYREGRTDDVVLVPASITYDQLREVNEFAGEARGGAKQKESIGWLVGFMRGNRRGRLGKIYVRFGKPLSLRELLGPQTRSSDATRDEKDLELQKIGFEVAWRINEVTPATATALLTLALLGALDRALTYDQVRTTARQYLQEAQRRNIPLTQSARNLDTDGGVRAALTALIDQHVVLTYERGPDVVYGIGPDQHLAAAFYRNSIVHHFLIGSITELALARLAEPGVVDPVAAFWTTAMRLRDLLKFDFFFHEKEAFRADVAAELAGVDPQWRDRISDGPAGCAELLGGFQLLSAPLTLRSFFEAYKIVALALERHGSNPVDDENAFLGACEGYGRQCLLQKRIQSPESVSRHLFTTGFQLAANLGLVGSGDDLAVRRSAFAEEVDCLLRQLDTIEALALVEAQDLFTAVEPDRGHSVAAIRTGAQEHEDGQ